MFNIFWNAGAPNNSGTVKAPLKSPLKVTDKRCNLIVPNAD